MHKKYKNQFFSMKKFYITCVFFSVTFLFSHNLVCVIQNTKKFQIKKKILSGTY